LVRAKIVTLIIVYLLAFPEWKGGIPVADTLNVKPEFWLGFETVAPILADRNTGFTTDFVNISSKFIWLLW